ncbi:MAG: hypothetical protein QW091_00185 [Candidatus Micrarchaeaceae archaeon]
MTELLRLYTLDGSLDLLASICAAIASLASVSSILLVLGMLNNIALLSAFAASFALALFLFFKLRHGPGASESSAGIALLAATANVLILFVISSIW